MSTREELYLTKCDFLKEAEKVRLEAQKLQERLDIKQERLRVLGSMIKAITKEEKALACRK